MTNTTISNKTAFHEVTLTDSGLKVMLDLNKIEYITEDHDSLMAILHLVSGAVMVISLKELISVLVRTGTEYYRQGDPKELLDKLFSEDGYEELPDADVEDLIEGEVK